MLTVLTLLIRRKNPVIADFTEAKRNRQDAKNKCCNLIFIRIYFQEKMPGSISGLFRRESVGFSLDVIVFFARHDLIFSLSLF